MAPPRRRRGGFRPRSTCLLRDPAAPPLSMRLKKKKKKASAHGHRKPGARRFMEALFKVVKSRQPPRCPPTAERAGGLLPLSNATLLGNTKE